MTDRTVTDLLNADTTPAFDDLLIRDYLQANPDFFVRFPDLLTSLRLPHQQRGTVSLVEHQQMAQRQRVQQLEEEITALMTMATRNEQIYRFNNQLSVRLLKCQGLDELKQVLASELKTQFHFSHVNLIPVHDLDTDLVTLWRKRLDQGYYFGRLTQMESQRLFAADVGSVALTRLTSPCAQLIFAIASPNPSHFQSDMDHLLLDQIKLLLEHLVAHY